MKKSPRGSGKSSKRVTGTSTERGFRGKPALKRRTNKGSGSQTRPDGRKRQLNDSLDQRAAKPVVEKKVVEKTVVEKSVVEKQEPANAVVRFVTIDSEDAGQRVDNYLIRVLKGVPKTRIYRIIRKGEVRVNKKRITADYRLQNDDLLRIPPVRVAEAGDKIRPADSILEKLEQSILYEDSRLLVINKPSGLAVHGGSGLSYGVIEAFRQIRPDNKTLELVHRLDRDTSGVLMIAKRRSMLRHLHNQLQMKTKVVKLYQALVIGKWPARKLLVNAPLQKNVVQSGERMVRVDMDGKKSRTEYRVLNRFPGATLVEASPITGRTHQIRVHCLHAGHAILGDDKYCKDEYNQQFRLEGLKRLFLHAASIQFETPEGEMLKIEAPLPVDLQRVLDKIGKKELEKELEKELNETNK